MRDAAGSGSGGAAGNSAGHSARDSDRVAWRLHGFDHRGTCYGFETTSIGDRARVVVNGKPALELPRIVWDALLSVVALQRGEVPISYAKDAGVEMISPRLRLGTVWDETEDSQLRAAWKAGSTIAELASLHQRTRGAVSARLKHLGLIDVDPIQQASASEPLAH